MARKLSGIHLHPSVRRHRHRHRYRAYPPLHGTIARVDHRERPPGLELLKLVRLLPAFAHSAAFAILVLGAASLRAAGPVGGVPSSPLPNQLSWDAAQPRVNNENRLDPAATGDGKALKYDLATATVWGEKTRNQSGIGLAMGPTIARLHVVANWNANDAMLLGFDRKRSNVRSNFVRVIDRGPVRYRFILSRHRFEVRLTKVF